MFSRNPWQVALALSYATVGYNVLEGIFSVILGYVNDSTALLGFGIDSFVESLSGIIMIWRFSYGGTTMEDQRREQVAIRLVGVSLIMLGTYVAYDALTALFYGRTPERNVFGLLIAVLSLIVMPALYLLKRRTAKALGSRSLATDAKQSLACVLLSVALLFGTGLNYVAGWWQADPVAALLIAMFLIYEGYRSCTEKELCC